MMNITNYLFMALMSLPGAYHDKETWQERSERMYIVAQAIDAASSRATCTEPYVSEKCTPMWLLSKKELAFLLVTKAWWESRFALNVHKGNCRKFECDAAVIKGVLIHRARTPWQIQRTGFVHGKEWDRMVGTDFKATRTAAFVAARVMSSMYGKCKNIRGAIAGYAAQNCTWSGAGRRFIFWEKLMAKSEQQLTEEAEARRVIHEEHDLLGQGKGTTSRVVLAY